MEQIKIIMEALSQMGAGAQTAFMAWCVKEVLVYLVCPLTFGVIGFTVYKILINLLKPQKKSNNSSQPEKNDKT